MEDIFFGQRSQNGEVDVGFYVEFNLQKTIKHTFSVDFFNIQIMFDPVQISMLNST